MANFPQMVEVVPEGNVGVATVSHFEVSERDSRFTAIRGGMDYVPAGRYAKLLVKGCLYMSDTRMERMTNSEVVREARGHVLIAGLGLGMILHPIVAKTDVESVTVVEKYPDVIALIRPTIQSPKVSLVKGDIFTWRPAKGTRYDTIYFDIWAHQSTDELERMTKLHRSFRPFMAKGAWMNSWRRDWLRAQKRSNRWY